MRAACVPDSATATTSSKRNDVLAMGLESVASIREFVGAMVLADELRGIFVTSAHMTNSGEGDKPSFNLRTTQRC